MVKRGRVSGSKLGLEKNRSKSIFALLEKDHKATFQNLDRFYEALKNLRFEGKQNLGKNISEIREFVSYFKREIKTHMREEEKILFPFLQTHVPRLEPMICLLLSEHGDFRNCLNYLGLSLSEFRKTGSDKTRLIHGLNEQGTYLVCLLRGHMWLETQSLYRAADRELHRSEKKQLIEQITKIGGHHVLGRRSTRTG